MSNLVPRPLTFQDNTPEAQSILDFCTRGLLIPGEFLEKYTRVPDFDAFYIHTKNGLRFSISGPEVSDWEYRRGMRKVCSPERELDD